MGHKVGPHFVFYASHLLLYLATLVCAISFPSDITSAAGRTFVHQAFTMIAVGVIYGG